MVSAATKILSEIVLLWYHNHRKKTSLNFCILISTSIQKHNWKTKLLNKIYFITFSYISRRQGFDSHVLRFRAKMISNIPENEDRIFIIRVYLMDDTISIYELAKRNSGKRFFPYYYYQFNVIIKILNITVIKFGSIILISPLSYAGKKGSRFI